MVADFASEFGIRLAGSGMRWPEFAHYTSGLFKIDSRLNRYFAPPSTEPKHPEEG